MRISGHESLQEFLFYCERKSKSQKPHFTREETSLLYDLAGFSLEEKYKKQNQKALKFVRVGVSIEGKDKRYNQKIPRLIRIDHEGMEGILERILERNPDILYN